MSELETLPARVTAVERALAEFRIDVRQAFEAVQSELRQSHDSLRQEIRDVDEQTRRYKRVLHEDLVERIKTIGER